MQQDKKKRPQEARPEAVRFRSKHHASLTNGKLAHRGATSTGADPKPPGGPTPVPSCDPNPSHDARRGRTRTRADRRRNGQSQQVNSYAQEAADC
jgi:hypothetical protein